MRGVRGSHTITLQTLFGNLEIRSPRWNRCDCQPQSAKTFSPLLELLDEHVSPERLYLESKWSSLISFELAAQLLRDTLPIAETINAATVRNHLQQVAERTEAELAQVRHDMALNGYFCGCLSRNLLRLRVGVLKSGCSADLPS
jgi:inorganic triphosphatase YgiF